MAFTSTRTGNGDVYVLRLASGDVTRLTFDDVSELALGFLAHSGELAVGDGQSPFCRDEAHELVGTESERHLRELEPAARPVDASSWWRRRPRG